jgi:hypothetical protein
VRKGLKKLGAEYKVYSIACSESVFVTYLPFFLKADIELRTNFVGKKVGCTRSELTWPTNFGRRKLRK